MSDLWRPQSDDQLIGGLIFNPQLSVTRVEEGREKGKYGLYVHGREMSNTPGGGPRITLIQLRVFDTLAEAAVTFEAVRDHRITVDDVPNFEVRMKDIRAWQARNAMRSR